MDIIWENFIVIDSKNNTMVYASENLGQVITILNEFDDKIDIRNLSKNVIEITFSTEWLFVMFLTSKAMNK